MKNYLDVLIIFLIPFGGGIPGGVLLASARGIPWLHTLPLYALSDIILAIVFEPILNFFIRYSRHNPKLANLRLALKQFVHVTLKHFGNTTNIFTLILITFTTDPMTGRIISRAAGYGRIGGWAIAITGDLVYYTVIMASTLWLNEMLGSTTKTMAIILVLMFFLPSLIRRIKTKNK